MNKKSQFEAILLLAMKSLEVGLRDVDRKSGQNNTDELLRKATKELREKFQQWLDSDSHEYKYYDILISHPWAPELNVTAHLGVGKTVCGVSLLFHASQAMCDLVHSAHEVIWSERLPESLACLGLTEEQLETFRSLRKRRYDGYFPKCEAPIVTYWL